MYFYVSILMTLVVLLFIVSGILLKSGRYLWPFSGPETKRELQSGSDDIKGLRNSIGNFCFVVAAILLLAGIFDHYHVFFGLVISIASLFFVVAFILIRVQRYDRHILPERKRKRGARVLLGILVVILVIVGGMLIYGSIEQGVDVGTDRIEIGGLCGTTIDMNGVSGIFIIKELPKIQSKNSGFDFANVLKGNFRLQGIGEGKLYVNTSAPPFIEMKYDGSFVIMNFKDSTTTYKIYNTINGFRKGE
jgi:hypothetical protein